MADRRGSASTCGSSQRRTQSLREIRCSHQMSARWPTRGPDETAFLLQKHSSGWLGLLVPEKWHWKVKARSTRLRRVIYCGPGETQVRAHFSPPPQKTFSSSRSLGVSTGSLDGLITVRP